MKARIRVTNNVNMKRTSIARLMGSDRGFGDVNALEVCSNDIAPTIGTMCGCVYFILEPYDRQQTDTDDRERQTAD